MLCVVNSGIYDLTSCVDGDWSVNRRKSMLVKINTVHTFSVLVTTVSVRNEYRAEMVMEMDSMERS